MQAKGKAEPLPLFRPLAARARFGSDVTRTHATQLVGRELEKQLLVGTFERSAQQRSCQLVTIVGEPGVGKSRLCAELFYYTDEHPELITWRQGRCLPHGEGIALGEIAKAECGSSSPTRLRRRRRSSSAPCPRTTPTGLAQGPPRSARRGARRACLAGGVVHRLAALLRVARRRGPTVLVFEDLHWADEALLSLLEHLADWSQGVALLLLCTARPELQEQHPTWAAGLRNAHTINLAPLTDEETARLIASLLERAVLPAETQRALLERACG